MSTGCFHTLNLVQFRKICDELHARVARGHGRIEITVEGCEDVCVLISKAELESLERALEILAETQDFRSMCQSLASVAASTVEAQASQSA
ncbi:MAG TPA: type II toxin-antitoxin system prevent-host-death family antitoxin [Tepidisphaeraceae bacterium]